MLLSYKVNKEVRCLLKKKTFCKGTFLFVFPPLTCRFKVYTRKGSKWKADWQADRLLSLSTAKAKWALSIKGSAVAITGVLTVAPPGLPGLQSLPCRGDRCWSAVPCPSVTAHQLMSCGCAAEAVWRHRVSRLNLTEGLRPRAVTAQVAWQRSLPRPRD